MEINKALEESMKEMRERLTTQWNNAKGQQNLYLIDMIESQRIALRDFYSLFITKLQEQEIETAMV